MFKAPAVTLIISTYNWPEALNLCLLSVKSQNILPDEVIIADDGSALPTSTLIDEFRTSFPVPLVHVWQKDDGFQLSKIRNKAIAAARHEYIVQVDGDQILHPEFIQDHKNFSKRGSFVTGSRVLLDETLSGQLLESSRTKLSLFSKGIKNRLNAFRFSFFRNYLFENYRKNDIYYMRGSNMAFWREDLLKVNGYNEDIHGWGREDNEIAVRLINAGVAKRFLKFGSIVFHIYHPEKPRNNLDNNDCLLRNVIENRSKYCDNGLDKYLKRL